MQQTKRLFDIDPWKIASTTLDKTQRRLQESLTSIGNGYMGMRGNFEETYSGDHHQGTYLAGVWYPDKTRVGWWKNGYPEYFGKVINAMNFISLELILNGQLVDLATTSYDDFYLELDMKNGILSRQYTVITPKTTVRFTFERFLSLDNPELGVVKFSAESLKGNGSLSVISKLDNNIHNEDSNYDEMFWEEQAINEVVDPFSYLTVRTIPNEFQIEQFTVTAAMTHISQPEVNPIKTTGPLVTSEIFEFDLLPNQPITLEKRIAIITSRDHPQSTQLAKATAILNNLKNNTYSDLRQAQDIAWAKRWELADVVIEGDEEAQQGIRFNLFQLFSTYYGEDERLNIGPKGFTGEKYGGATYWDTEAYAVPLYLALADSSVTKNLLKYRHNQLAQAQHNAKQQGLDGALYPMVTFTGVECHNEWEITFEEIHRNGAIAYAIYNYTNYTGDTSYLETDGLEVLIEIAKFWADRVHYSTTKGKYMIHGVTGPNEYENNINNNWYTNTIAAWVLRYTSESYYKYKEITPHVIPEATLKNWEDIITNMYYPTNDELGIFVQHDTFLDKELIAVNDLDPKHLPLNQKWSWDRILRSCFIKQADVLQGIYFFGNHYTLEEKQANFDFYEPMTVHESSLSPSIHAILAAELGFEEKAVEMYQRTARLDLDNYNNDTEDGLHITSMTGSWLAIVQGFAQMKTFDEHLSFAPFLPKKWEKYEFHINYRQRLLKICVDDTVTLTLLQGNPLDITLYGSQVTLTNVLTVPTQSV
ncbi:glycoside hydrolase family 65 protein [Vagococcus intermedius]|uniref:Glycoside hydrolase family 65 protein n=1 Tax=Vagococcus intermedius TaxID=2991418 RepID=A0AAF0CWM8_9ENTE|nr:glycoside hydrolase family 65 protein [Vagococcus intermedius]WEG74217.1 glycoside hydrolase family 65 protein [Vagococcus intermedius]WEG76299.1 glycoside hydrolase family 65 protein [Vagococcus intermedius]